MPSDKRARQRAARYEKQAQLQRAQKRKRFLRRGASFAALLIAVVIIIVLVGSSGGKKKNLASGSTTTTSGPSTTTSTTVLQSSAIVPTCPTAHETKRIVWFTKAPPNCIPKTSVWDATFNTSLGTFVVNLPAAKSYAAVNNFVFLAKWNYYNDTFFHRVIPGFVVQGGDPTGTGTGGPHQYPGYSYTGNTPPASCKTSPNGPGCYEPYDFAMANSSGPSTNGSQFFIILPGGQKVLNTEPNYTLFGKVISGTKVVDQIGKDGSQSGTPNVKVYVRSVTVKQVA